jgi:hypothetical protein
MSDLDSKDVHVVSEALSKPDVFGKRLHAPMNSETPLSSSSPIATQGHGGKSRSPAPSPSRRTLQPDEYRKLLRRCNTFAGTLRHDRDFAQSIRADPAGFRADLESAMRVQFPMRRGRPTDPQLDAACRMVGEGKSVPEVLRTQIPGWDSLDPYARYLTAKGLRQAVVRRKRVHRIP